MEADARNEMRVDVIDGAMDALRKNRKLIFWYGLGLTIIGILALFFPMVSTLAAELFIGLSFLFAGLVGFIGSFSVKGTGPFFGALLWSLLQVAAGIFLVVNPLAGAVALTLFIAVLFMFQGAYELALAFTMGKGTPRGWVILSAIISILAGVLIASGMPGLSVVVLGVLVGVNFLSSGLALMMLSRTLRRDLGV